MVIVSARAASGRPSPSHKPAPTRLDAKNIRREDFPSIAAFMADNVSLFSFEEERGGALSDDAANDRDGLWRIGCNNRNASPPFH
mmetsp:Transcript_7382/g.15816  ORF Transcript_7382/g.15816 Transcript_7382/m.15816 type:complete len:85 (+) Transcript_7382:3098-3352(+)